MEDYTTEDLGRSLDLDGRELKVGQRVAYSVGGRGHQHDLLTGEVVRIDSNDIMLHYPVGHQHYPKGYSGIFRYGQIAIKPQQAGRKPVIRGSRHTVIITESSAE